MRWTGARCEDSTNAGDVASSTDEVDSNFGPIRRSRRLHDVFPYNAKARVSHDPIGEDFGVESHSRVCDRALLFGLDRPQDPVQSLSSIADAKPRTGRP